MDEIDTVVKGIHVNSGSQPEQPNKLANQQVNFSLFIIKKIIRKMLVIDSLLFVISHISDLKNVFLFEHTILFSVSLSD